MAIDIIQSYLTGIGRGVENPPEIYGGEVLADTPLFSELQKIFDGSEVECTIPIRFNRAPDGSQNNSVKKLITDFYENPEYIVGKPIAERLRNFTTGVTKAGLLFLIRGTNSNKEKKLVVSRFPAEKGILADLRDRQFHIELLSQIFMKNPSKYKAALFSGTNIIEHFWLGQAIDKQVNFTSYKSARYWIKDFLDSDYRITSSKGSEIFATALKNATNSASDVNVKHALVLFGNMVGGYDNQVVSISEMMDSFNLANNVKEALISQLPNEGLTDVSFEFSYEEFQSHITYKLVELDNGATLIGLYDEFDDTFIQTLVEGSNKRRFVTEGEIIEERLRNRK